MSNPDIWRYRCPNGHTSWVHRNSSSWSNRAESKYYCNMCRKNGDDPHFEQLEDLKA